MKFTTPIIALLAATSAYSFTLEKRVNEDDIAQIQNQLQNEDIQKIAEEHKDEINDALNQSGISTEDKEKIDQMMNGLSSGTSTNPLSGSAPSTGSDSSNPTSNDNTTGTTFATGEGSAFDPKCKALIEKYYGCLPRKMDKSNYDQCCDHFNSDECAKIVNTKLTDNVECKNAKDDEVFLNKILGTMFLACAKDGNSYCPISKLYKEGKELSKDAVNDSCKKTACRGKAISGISSIKALQQDMASVANAFSQKTKRGDFNNMDEALAILNSKECEAQASSALAIKMGSSLLLTAALFLYFF